MSNSICISSNFWNRYKLLAIALLFCFAGCGGGAAVSYKSTDAVFDVSFVEFLADGRPLIAIKPNGKPRPKGNGPFGDFYLVLRPDSSTPYVRQFSTADADNGATRDFMVKKDDLAAFKRVTVSVENPDGGKLDNPTLLSNIIEIPIH